MEKEKQLHTLLEWVKKQDEVLKFSQIYDYAYRVLKYNNLKQSEISKVIRLLPQYAMNSLQQRKKLRGKKYRPMIVNSLGNLHADIGFFAKTREYEMPPSFQNGFLVCKDTLSRFSYIHILTRGRKAPEMEKAFNDIFTQFRKQNDGARVQSVSFDMERSIMGLKMQNYFSRKKVAFHAFQNTSSKSKMAENAIRQIRRTISIIKSMPNAKEIRWWHIIKHAVDTLNNQPIEINKKLLKYPNPLVSEYYTPSLVNASNVDDFIDKLHKAAPAHFFTQFDIFPRWEKFRFKVGDFVRAKLIITSSEVIGTKRSEITLNKEIFVVQRLLPYVSAQLTVENAYVCKSIDTDNVDVFDENDLALASISPQSEENRGIKRNNNGVELPTTTT